MGSDVIRTCGASLRPQYGTRFRTVTFDLVGSGQSDLSAYDPGKYASLDGYADDVLEIIAEFARARPSSSGTPSAR